MSRDVTPRAFRIDDAEVAVHEVGEGEPILYLHGFPTSGYLWRRVMAVTGESFHAIAPDLPGFGRSDLSPRGHGWRDLVGWVDRFVDTMTDGQVHLAVHDWGGLIGLTWFCEHPEKVKSLLITDTSFSATDRWHALATEWRKPEIGEQYMDSLSREGIANMLAATVQRPLDDVSLDEYFAGLATPERRAAKLQMYRSLDFDMLEPYMAAFDRSSAGKTRLVWAGSDPFVPVKIGRRLAERTGGELTVIEAAGHFLQEDAGEEVGALHLDFLKGFSASRAC